MKPPRRTLLGVTPPPHANEQLRCTECGLVTPYFRGWSFTVRPRDGGRGVCDGAASNTVTGHHRWVIEAKP